MKTNINAQRTTIQTIRVYSKNEQVFVKNHNENWLPISFHWIQSSLLEE